MKKTFKELNSDDIIYVISFNKIVECKVDYCRPYNGHHCLLIKDFFTSNEYPVDSDKSIEYIDKYYIVLNKEDIHECQMKCLIKRRNKLYGLLNGVRKAERTYIKQIDEVEDLINKCNE